MRVLVFIASFIAAGVSFPKLIATDAMRRRNFLKDGVPAVDDSHERVLAPGRTYHDLKNVMTEWVRADPQMAAKFLAFVALVGWVVVVLVALVWLAS